MALYGRRRIGKTSQQRLDRLLDIIRDSFEAYVGKTGYEEICRRHVAALSDSGKLPFDALDVGRIWDRRVEIDIAAIDRRSQTALLGECRWRRSKVGVEVLEGLMSRATELRKLRGYKLHYMLFSRSGFTDALEKRARRERIRLVRGVPGTTAPG